MHVRRSIVVRDDLQFLVARLSQPQVLGFELREHPSGIESGRIGLVKAQRLRNGALRFALHEFREIARRCDEP